VKRRQRRGPPFTFDTAAIMRVHADRAQIDHHCRLVFDGHDCRILFVNGTDIAFLAVCCQHAGVIDTRDVDWKEYAAAALKLDRAHARAYH
jgi:hypothetical protein